MSTVFVESAKVMAKGQVTVPKSVRNRLGVDSGDRLVFVVDDDEVRVVNSARYAMSGLRTVYWTLSLKTA
ncbi:AbrB/MazE/SpoVT family DNA-binding domain-containing protein [Actinotignum sp. GS-2025e]|uniref:AbrB/MazE/SpoVT family DNA-binding domain-containing protein n=1 Tax=Actinotignum sp. GS-2025e TaxID=3427278 RepID=UPI003F46C808